jgi:hypothetical protein
MARSVEDRHGHIGQELFDLVEYDQGKGFISDGLHVLSDVETVEIVRDVALPRSRSAVKKMAAWLRKYEHLARKTVNVERSPLHAKRD